MDAETLAERLYRYEETAPKVAHPDQVGAAEVDFFAAHGYLAVENVWSGDEVAAARQAMEELIKAWEPGTDLLQFEAGTAEPESLSPAERAAAVRKLWRFVEHHDTVKALSQHPALHAIMEALVGEEVALFQDMGLIKPPRIGREKPWHQDTAYFNLEPLEKIVGCWLAVDPATLANGCMHVIPGSHRQGPKRHVHDRDCQLPDEQVEVSRDVAVPLAPGGCLFFSGLTHHGTPPNLSDQPRWALQFHYHGVTCRQVAKDLYAFKDDDGNFIGC